MPRRAHTVYNEAHARTVSAQVDYLYLMAGSINSVLRCALCVGERGVRRRSTREERVGFVHLRATTLNSISDQSNISFHRHNALAEQHSHSQQARSVCYNRYSLHLHRLLKFVALDNLPEAVALWALERPHLEQLHSTLPRRSGGRSVSVQGATELASLFRGARVFFVELALVESRLLQHSRQRGARVGIQANHGRGSLL